MEYMGSSLRSTTGAWMALNSKRRTHTMARQTGLDWMGLVGIEKT